MTDIINESGSHRIFYFHEFIYFTDALDYDKSQTEELLKSYFIAILLVFDKILIPLEHINISRTETERRFKQRFLNTPFARELESSKRIITTRWAPCSDNDEHGEAATRYMQEIGASDYHTYKDFKNIVSGMQVYQRNQAEQSMAAANYISHSINPEIKDLLLYEDGKILINLSVENGLLGHAKENIDEHTANLLKKAYISAMPDGNGRIYRSIVHSVESVIESGDVIFFPFSSKIEINPVLLRHHLLKALLKHIGFRLPHPPFETWIYDDKKWIQWFCDLLNQKDVSHLKDKVFDILCHMTKFNIVCDKEFYDTLQYIKVIRITNIIPRILRIIFNYKKFFINKGLDTIAEAAGTKYVILDDTVVEIFNGRLKHFGVFGNSTF